MARRTKQDMTVEEARAFLDKWAVEQTEIFDAREALLKDPRARADLWEKYAQPGFKVANGNPDGREKKTVGDEELVDVWLRTRTRYPKDKLYVVCGLTGRHAAVLAGRPNQPFNAKYIENLVRPLLKARGEWNRGRGPTKKGR